MNIEDIMLLDFYGGVKHIDIKEYFEATPFWNNTLYESFIFLKKMVVNVKDGKFFTYASDIRLTSVRFFLPNRMACLNKCR